jgi:hypothetical protein
MSNYLDKLSYESHLEEQSTSDDYMLSPEQQSGLLDTLFNYEDFIIMISNYNATERLLIDDVRACIVYLFKHSDGIADIRQCAYAVTCCIDNIEPYWIDINKMMTQLFEKYDNI